VNPMDPSQPAARPRLLIRVLAGLQVGVTGGLWMLLWFAVHSLVLGQRWYAVPNLLGSTFFGDHAFRSGAGWVTASGFALHVLASGCVGVLFGLVAPASAVLSGLRAFLLGLLAGVLWYYVLFEPFWKIVNPWVPLYSSHRTMVVAHLIYGAWLARWRRAAMAIQGQIGEDRAPDGTP